MSELEGKMTNYYVTNRERAGCDTRGACTARGYYLMQKDKEWWENPDSEDNDHRRYANLINFCDSCNNINRSDVQEGGRKKSKRKHSKKHRHSKKRVSKGRNYKKRKYTKHRR